MPVQMYTQSPGHIYTLMYAYTHTRTNAKSTNAVSTQGSAEH